MRNCPSMCLGSLTNIIDAAKRKREAYRWMSNLILVLPFLHSTIDLGEMW